jgi:hypothetical protein
MSNYGQAILTVVGTIVGAYIGYPQLGFVLGSLAGQALFPTQLDPITGPRLNDTRTTNSAIGAPVQELFGTDAVAGTVIYLGPMVETATTEEVGGKGGPEQDVTTYSYAQTIAVGLVRGPQAGVRRIWENGKLVYDAREQLDDETADAFAARLIANAAYEETFVLYLGDEEQLPDPTMQAERVVAPIEDETPAYRGLMYIVYPNRALQEDQGLRHPNFKFEITEAGVDYLVVAVASNTGLTDNGIMISHDGTTWEQIEDLPGNGLQDVCFSSSLNLFVAASSQADAFLLSQDGETWTLSDSVPGAVASWFGVAWSEELGIFASCMNATGTDRIATSPDGVTWTRQTTPSGSSLVCIDWFEDLGLFVALPSNGSQDALYSSDGITWTAAGIPQGAEDLTWAGDRILATSRNEPFTHLRSFDGITWDTQNVLGAGAAGRTSIASDGQTVISTTLATIGYASDSTVTNYTNAHTVTGQRAEGSTYARGLGMYVVCGLDGAAGTTGFAVDISEDGLTWTPVDTDHIPGGLTWTGICEGAALTEDSSVTLAAIVTALCERVGLTDIDVSDLEDRTIEGYVISRVMSAADAIEPLRKVGFFDIVESGTTLKFVTRGQAAVLTLTTDDLGAHDGTSDSPPPSVVTRMMQDKDLPRQMRVHFRNPDRDYEDDEELSPTRLITEAVNDVDVELPMSIFAEQAAQVAEVMWSDAWAGRFTHSFSLDYSMLHIEPADVLLLPVDDEMQRVRVLSIDDGSFAIRKIESVRDDDGSYTSYAVGGTVERVGGALEFISGTELVFLDLPPLRTEDTDAGIYIAAYSSDSGTTWRGASVYRSTNDGESFDNLVAVTTEAAVGSIVSASAGEQPGGSPSFDENGLITVELESGTFESRIESDVFTNGANTLVIGAKGRWLLVSFCNATQITETRWELSKLLWGRRGTEYLIGSTQVGDTAVLISGNGIVRAPLTVAQIGEEYIYKAVSIGADFNDGTDFLYAGNGESLEPFAPTNIDFALQANGDILISWTRRDRLGQELTGYVDPISDPPLAFEVDILAGGSPTVVLRTLSSSVESVTYSNADQFSDFGSPTPMTLSVIVYQVSPTAAIDRGHPAELLAASIL